MSRKLKNDLDAKIQELNSKSDTVTSVALQVSTLTLQLEELRKQLENSVSQSKIEELQMIIDRKSAELDTKEEELKQRSTQAQRLLQIIAAQVQIERMAAVASNESDYAKIRGLQENLNNLIEGIQDTDNENTKLMFQILAKQDEISRLKREGETQLGAQAQKIKDLENELETVRNQITEKTNLLETRTTGIANLSAQIMDLSKKIIPLQEEISDLKQTYSENLAGLQRRLNFTERKLQIKEFQLSLADANNYQLIMNITDLRAALKKAKEAASTTVHSMGLEQQLKAQQKENTKLEGANRDLKQQIDELEVCCNSNTHCEGKSF